MVKEINAAIAAKIYKDERVLINDMINLESPVFKNERFKERINKEGIAPGTFSAAFREEAIDQGIAKGNKNQRVNELYFVSNGLFVYFPYSEDTQYINYPTTVVSATVDANSAYATHPLCDDATPATYAYCSQSVLVNDAYAEANPTHIVVAGGEAASSYQTTGQNLAVKLGYIKCVNQYDHLISFTQNGGGSEIMFGRIDGYGSYANNGTVISWAGDLMRIDIGRSQIRKKQWIQIQAIWDPNWETDNPQQVLGIYEEDNTNSTVTFTGSVTTKSGNNTIGPIGFTIVGKSKDAIIRIQTMDRAYILTNAASGMDLGHGKIDNWPIWDGRLSVSYSLPLQNW